MDFITYVLGWLVAISAAIVLVPLLVIALHRNLFQKMKFLVIYVIVANLETVPFLWIGQRPLPLTHPRFFLYFYSYWISAFVLSFLRLLIIIEICERILVGYPAIRSFAWRILIGLAMVLFSGTAYYSARNAHHLRTLITMGQQATDTSLAVLLLTLLGIGVYYRIRVPPLYKLVLIGSCIYSTEQLVTNRVDRYLSASTNFPLDLVQRFAYVGMLSIWLWAVWRWGKSSTPPPDLVSQATYDELSPQIHDRLRELNDKLAKLIQR